MCDAGYSSGEIDMFVDFIGKHDYVGMLPEHSGQSLKFFMRIYGSCRIGGGVEHDYSAFWSNHFLKLGGCYLEPIFRHSLHSNGRAFSQLHHLHIAHPCRHGDYHLVTGIYQSQNHIGQFMLCTVAHDYAFRREIEPVFAFQFIAHHFTKAHVAGHGGIARKIIINGFLGCILDKVGGVEIGFAGRQADHVDASGAKFSGFLKHSECGRDCEAFHSVGYLYHGSCVFLLS